MAAPPCVSLIPQLTEGPRGWGYRGLQFHARLEPRLGLSFLGALLNLTAYIDPTLCRRCGICVIECGRHLATASGNTVDLSSPLCSQCFHCLAICPRGAIRLKAGDVTEVFAYQGASPVLPEDLLRLLSLRRSHRDFEDREVEPELVDELMQAASYIPSGGNRRSHRFIALGRTETRAKLLEEIRNVYRKRVRIIQSPFLSTLLRPFLSPGNREFLTDVVYRERMIDLIARLGAGEDPVFYSAPLVFVIYSATLIPTPDKDAILAAYAMNLMADSLGLGACMVSLAQNAVNSSPSCKKTLGIPSRAHVNAVLVVGHPRKNFQRSAPRERPTPVWL